MARYTTIEQSLLFRDTATQDTHLRMPLVDVVRGHLIAKDGMFATTADDGTPVAGYARFGWSEPERKLTAKLLPKATQVIPVGLPSRPYGVVEGYVAVLADAEAKQLGVDLCQWGEHTGVIAFTADALALILTGVVPQRGTPERAAGPLVAIPLAEGLVALKAGSTRDVPARVNAQGVVTAPALKGVPAFPEGKAVEGERAAATPEIAPSPYASILNGKVQVETELAAPPEVRNGYGMGGFGRSRRGRNR